MEIDLDVVVPASASSAVDKALMSCSHALLHAFTPPESLQKTEEKKDWQCQGGYLTASPPQVHTGTLAASPPSITLSPQWLILGREAEIKCSFVYTNNENVNSFRPMNRHLLNIALTPNYSKNATIIIFIIKIIITIIT